MAAVAIGLRSQKKTAIFREEFQSLHRQLEGGSGKAGMISGRFARLRLCCSPWLLVPAAETLSALLQGRMAPCMSEFGTDVGYPRL